MSDDRPYFIDRESGIVYQLPMDADKCVWFVNIVERGEHRDGRYRLLYSSVGPMSHAKASSMFDRLDDRGVSCYVSREQKIGWD